MVNKLRQRRITTRNWKGVCSLLSTFVVSRIFLNKNYVLLKLSQLVNMVTISGAVLPVAGLHDGSSTEGSPFTSEFKKFALKTLEKWHVPGMGIAVISVDDFFLEGFGVADVEAQIPVTPDTLFMMGSTTKAFTDAVLGVLVDSGNFSTPRRTAPGYRATISRARTSSPTPSRASAASLPRLTLCGRYDTSRSRRSRALSLVAPEVKPEERLARGYWWDSEVDGYKELDPVPQRELRCVSGAGLIISSIRDYALWVKSQLEESGPLSKAAHAALREPKMTEGPGRGAWDPSPAYASGLVLGFGTAVFFLPDDGFGLVTVGNTDLGATVAGEVLLWKLVDDRLGVPEEKRFDWEKKWVNFTEGMGKKLENAVDILFPAYKSKPLPHSLLVEAYVGTYYHPAYRNMTLELEVTTSKGGQTTRILKADRSDFTWQTVATFEHVSGEYWVMSLKLAQAPASTLLADFAAAEFKVGVDGKVTQLGVEWRDTLSGVVDGWIWYDRID
ncbi:hypothetical protein B0H67DRAFT_685799 [Lasiosphaeris hirsuta]|uniref:Beta-lactamase-related domain-containing protein n=1 Tax=Lasiosphaeris hirsuta TaxID=260670 RepID=A0AA40A1A7_9PEZI|nr:hypothetical protein B0H67DRAFT_685799 [Lasiosphaeris hirsuta]